MYSIDYFFEDYSLFKDNSNNPIISLQNITIPFVGNLSNTTNITTVTVLSSNIRDNPDMNFYVTVYGLSVIAIVFLMILRAIIFMKVGFYSGKSCLVME